MKFMKKKKKRSDAKGHSSSPKKSRKPSTMGYALNAQDVLKALKQAKRPLRMHDLFRELRLSKKHKDVLELLLEDLLAQGKVLRLRGGAYGLAESLRTINGQFEVQRSGMGFVLPDDKKYKDIFVAPTMFNGAMHGDRVVVAILPGQRGKNPDGRILRVLERAHEKLTCRVVRKLGKSGFLCRPTDPRLRISLLVDPDELDHKPVNNELLVVAPEELVEEGLWGAVALESLGREDDVKVQERLVKLNHDIPGAFPEEVLEQAAGMPAVPSEQDTAGRVDLRHLDLVTIDGATARDFDDAVYVERQGDGYRLWVAIADVSHYVRTGSALDAEAQLRANSYYFPQSVEPMFPEALSNGLCSLNPRVDRLAVVAETYFYADGSYGKSKFYEAVIQSKARLTYSEVQQGLLLRDDEVRKKLAPVLPMLEAAEELARLLKEQRSMRGSLDFDLPEAQIEFNVYGETMDIKRKVRHFGHMMIEEFMIAANEAVARYLTEHEAPFLYRIHPDPDPDKLTGLFRLLSRTELGEDIPQMPGPQALQHILKKAEGTELEFLVNRLALRTMMQAQYIPEHQGHFGLASECYSHFTSPIRRYADLVVHRALKNRLHIEGYADIPSAAALRDVGDHLNTRERKAMEAEREIRKRLTVLFMRDRVGEEFTGVVSGVTDFGFWVELEEVMAEGLVRLSTMDDDYYGFIPERQELVGERTGKIYRLGQKVRVWLADVNLARLEVNLNIAEESVHDPIAER